jgi:Fungalysin metallopeptidase (M36)/PKD domain
VTAADSIAIGVRPAVNAPERDCAIAGPRVPRRAALAAAVGLASWLGAHGAAPAVPSSTAVRQYFDARAVMIADVGPTVAQRAAITALGARVRWDAQYGAPVAIVRHGGYLSAPGADARQFVRDNAVLFGLTSRDVEGLVVVQEYVTRHNGARHVAFQQTDSQRVVHGSLLRLTLDSAGRVLTAGGALFPGAAASGEPSLSAEKAASLAARDSGVRLVRPATAQLVTFPMPGRRPARLAWRALLQTGAGWLDTVVDAQTGRLLYRTDHRAYASPHGTVFTVQHPDLGAAQVVSFSGAAFDNAGWVTDRATAGNNANAYQDLNNDDVADYQPQTPPFGDPDYQHFDFPFADAFRTSGGVDVTTDRDAAVTQAFYRVNFLHDYFYALGFDEPAGNFQDDNFGRGGIGNDGMLVEVDNSATGGTAENSNTQTPPGQRPRMEIVADKGTDRDGAFDADHVTHEYTHGVSNRLVMTEAVGGNLPFGNQSWALGEGWSEFFGTSITDDPNAGEYICGGCTLYPFDDSPLVYSQLCTLHPAGCEPHRDGEIWTAALWDLRAALGKAQAEQLVIDGIKSMAPIAATFLDGRDGILAADMATSGAARQCLIWRVFAGREMGVSASTVTSPALDTVTPATDVPASCVPTANAGGPYTTPEGTDEMLNAGASTPGTDPSAGAIAQYRWDLDNDGEYDDAAGATPLFTTVGQDGTFTIRLRVTNAAGISDTATTTITVTNVAPVISLQSIAVTVEGASVTLIGSASDPGWLDPLTATVDWDDGNGPQALTGAIEHARPNATLTFSRTHVYGDNGAFAITVCVSDDDVTSCAAVTATVANVPPTAVLAPAGQTSYGGQSVYVIEAGGSVSVTAMSADPGSDDLTLTWDWDHGADTVVVSLVNPPATDPAKSPSVQPRNLTLTRSHTYGDACLYDFTFSAGDDDGGASSVTAPIIVTGNATKVHGPGWWMTEYRDGPPDRYSANTLQCYLQIVVQLSLVFNTPLTRADAADILFPQQNHGSALELFDRQLLIAWLSFADGAIGLGDPVDTNGDGAIDTTFGAVLLAAETVRLSPTSTRHQILEQRNVLGRVLGGS